jgi:hypothetical protein
MHFHTVAVGDVRWKDCLSKEEGRIGSNTMEAFALLVLVNNCKAWLHEEHKTHQINVLAKHDSPPSCGRKPSIVDKILDGVQFNLDEETASPTAICNKTDRTCKKFEKERVKWLVGGLLQNGSLPAD